MLLFLGELADMSGEAGSRAYLDLPGAQRELMEQVVATGKLSPGGLLQAEAIMAKCPSKYEAKGGAAIGNPSQKL